MRSRVNCQRFRFRGKDSAYLTLAWLTGEYVYIATAVLFLIPASMIVFAGVGIKRRWYEVPSHDWSDRARIASLIVGACAILAGFFGKLAWLRAGGDPHGMGTPGGVWMILRKLFFSALALSAFFALLAKGRGRVLTLIALGIAFAADTVVYLLQMD